MWRCCAVVLCGGLDAEVWMPVSWFGRGGSEMACRKGEECSLIGAKGGCEGRKKRRRESEGDGRREEQEEGGRWCSESAEEVEYTSGVGEWLR